MGAWRQDGLADSYVGRNVTLTLSAQNCDSYININCHKPIDSINLLGS
jgi:hypothetical protein